MASLVGVNLSQASDIKLQGIEGVILPASGNLSMDMSPVPAKCCSRVEISYYPVSDIRFTVCCIIANSCCLSLVRLNLTFSLF